jgi:hypothetical protein
MDSTYKSMRNIEENQQESKAKLENCFALCPSSSLLLWGNDSYYIILKRNQEIIYKKIILLLNIAIILMSNREQFKCNLV